MRILVTGGTGLIGSQLVPLLTSAHTVEVLTRNVAMAEKVLNHKIPFHSSIDQFENLNDFDAVINLAGEPIVNKRWSTKQKAIIEHSRWDLTEQLVALIKRSDNPPSVFISGSAIGYYGRQGDQEISETNDIFHDEFSHQICKTWEEIALQAESHRTRVCILRTGIVLSNLGGALGKMLLPFKLGLGGSIGSGKQYMSWIHIQDMLNGIEFLLENQNCAGIYNFTAPTPITNKDFSKTLAASLNRPSFFTTPEFVLKLAMGEMADLLLYGQRVIPTRLTESGYQFTYAELDIALRSLRL